VTVPQLSLVSAEVERELDAIRAAIGTFENVRGVDDIVAVLRARIMRDERADLLDLIGHSRGVGFLVLGEWKLDDSPQTAATFSLLLRPLLEQLGVRTLRLLGCSTAVSPRSRMAMREIAHAARCAVVGTTRLVGRGDYGPGGFVTDWALSDADGRRVDLTR
jgi:hypothetical protein